MKKLERILIIVAVLSIAAKLVHMPMSAFLLVISLSALSIIYLLFSWLVLPAPGRRDHSWPITLISGLVLSISTIGILFKLQFWPLSYFYLMLSIPGLLMMTVVGFALRKSNAIPPLFAKGLLLRSLPVLVICIALMLLPGGTLTRLYYRNDPLRRDLLLRMNSTSDPEERERCMQVLDSLDQAKLRHH